MQQEDAATRSDFSTAKQESRKEIWRTGAPPALEHADGAAHEAVALDLQLQGQHSDGQDLRREVQC